MLKPPQFKPLEEESYRYQTPDEEEPLGEINIQHQMHGVRYPQRDASISGNGLQNIRDRPVINPFSNSASVSNPFSAAHSSSSSATHPQTGFYVFNPNEIDSASRHSTSPLCDNDLNHFAPVMNNETAAGIQSGSVFPKSIPNRTRSASPGTSSTADGYLKFLPNHYEQV